MRNLTDDEKRDITLGVPMTIAQIDSDGNVVEQQSYNLENVHISDFAVRSLARTLLPKVREFYSDPENVKRFEEWKALQEAEKINHSHP